MNNIIINGISSATIPGLLIQSLAPITLPAKRVNIEEIDGRSGDRSTFLGYSAYDKKISIGLTWGYDIDEIITYFNTDGTVIFSNEPDKYYNFELIQAINFERLIKFKTAEIVFHVQPFKFSVDDNEKNFDIERSTRQIAIYNAGNIYAKPAITITGVGEVGLSLNGNQIFKISMGDTPTSITIDTVALEAYTGTTLKNRQVTGNYENFIFKVGKNILTWSGAVTGIKIKNFSRWI